LVFSKKNIERSQLFYEKHGGKTIIFARFIPVVRTFAPVIAGVGKMPYRSFIFFNLIGALIWAVGVTLLGYFLGSVIPDIDKYLLPIAVFIIAISIAPAVWHLLKDQQQRADYLAHAKKAISKLKTRKNK
jgi:membrane-associated protein